MNRFLLPRFILTALTFSLLASPLVQAQSTSTLEQNKAVVRTFMEALYLKDDVGTAELLLSDDFLEHSPYLLEAAAVPASQEFPNPAQPDPKLEAPVLFTLEEVVAERDVVTTLLRVKEPARPAYYFMDLFKVHGGLIVEHWDTTEPTLVPNSSQPLSLKGKPSFFGRAKPTGAPKK